MSFINAPVDLALLPAAEQVPLQPIHRLYLRIMRIEWLLTTLVLALTAALFIYFLPTLRHSYGWILVAGSFLLITAYYFLAIEKSFPFLAYAVREKDVFFQRGWIIRKVRICPFNRIQNCSVQSGPLERRFGLATLVIYTAGSEGADLRIPGLLQEEADRIRHFILSKIHIEQHEAV